MDLGLGNRTRNKFARELGHAERIEMDKRNAALSMRNNTSSPSKPKSSIPITMVPIPLLPTPLLPPKQKDEDTRNSDYAIDEYAVEQTYAVEQDYSGVEQDYAAAAEHEGEYNGHDVEINDVGGGKTPSRKRAKGGGQRKPKTDIVESDLVCLFDAYAADCINMALGSTAHDDLELKTQSRVFMERMAEMFRVIIVENFGKRAIEDPESLAGRYTSAFLGCMDVGMYVKKSGALEINNAPIKYCVLCDMKCVKAETTNGVILCVLGTQPYEHEHVKLTDPVCNWLCTRHGHEFRLIYFVNTFDKLFRTRLAAIAARDATYDALLGVYGKKKPALATHPLPPGARVGLVYEVHPSSWTTKKTKPDAVHLISSFRETLKHIERVYDSLKE